MKKSILIICLLISAAMINQVKAEKEERSVPSFSEIALRIPATVYVEQGKNQSVEINAKSTTLEEIITDVSDRTLQIKFPGKKYLWKNFEPGKIEIFITVPEIDGLLVSGSGNIISDEIDSRIIEFTVSGSGDILVEELNAKRVTTIVSGSGDITIEDGGIADDFSANISGSGDINAIGFEADDVVIRIAGSGNCYITSDGSIKARIAGSGNVNYKGNALIDSTVAGSGKVKKM